MGNGAKRLGRLGLNRAGTCPVAYAIVVAADGVRHIAVELHDVTFKEAVFLEMNQEPEHRRLAVDRLNDAAFRRSMDDHTVGWLPKSMEHAR